MTAWDEFEATFLERSGNLKATARMAFLRREGKPYLHRGVILVNPLTIPETPRHRDYGKLVLEEITMTADAAKELAKRLVAGELRDSDFGIDIGYEPSLLAPWWTPEWPAPIGYSERISDWPAKTFLFKKKGGGEQGDPSGPLAAPGLPPIINVITAIDKWIGAPSQQISGMRNGLAYVLPDYTARIKEIRFDEDRITVSLEALEAKPEELSVQIKSTVRDDEIVSDVKRKGLTHIAPTNGVPESTYVFVFRDGDVPVDWARLYTGNPKLPPQVKFTVPEIRLRRLIEGGENQTVEFKAHAAGGSEFVESVIAFANTGDGVILVGVDDNGRVVGLPKPKKEERPNPKRERDRIINMIGDLCEPNPKVTVEIAKVEGKDLLIVRVSRGSHPPYWHRERRVGYVRREGTDFAMTRADLEEVYSKRSPRSEF